MNHEIVVGNIGSVYAGTSRVKATHAFHTYVDHSKTGYGRAAGENVVWLIDGEIAREYIGNIDREALQEED